MIINTDIIKRIILASTVMMLFNLDGLCQSIVKPQILSSSDWKNYFSKHFNLKNAETIKTVITPGDIPYPSVWKYSTDKDKKDKYMLFPVSANTDYMALPSNNGVGTYLFFFDHKNPEKNLTEMNFLADSVICKKLSTDVFMFQLNDDGFKINGDSSGFKRYLFAGKDGRIGSKSLVAHGCVIKLNSVDTVHSIIYLDVIYPKHPSCSKCFRFDYKNFLLLTDLDDVEDLNGSIVVDAVHYCPIKKIEETTN